MKPLKCFTNVTIVWVDKTQTSREHVTLMGLEFTPKSIHGYFHVSNLQPDSIIKICKK